MKFQAFHVNPGEKLKKKDVNNNLSNFMSVFPNTYLPVTWIVIVDSKLLQWSRFLVGITVFKFLRKFRNVWWHGKCQRSGPHIIILRKGWHLSDFLQIVFHILALKTQQFWTFLPHFLKQYMYIRYTFFVKSQHS